MRGCGIASQTGPYFHVGKVGLLIPTRAPGSTPAAVKNSSSRPTKEPTSTLFADFHGHSAEFIEDLPTPAQRPPVIEINFHRPPHGDPPSDGETLGQEAWKRSRTVQKQQLDNQQANAKKGQTDDQAHPSMFHKPLKLQLVQSCSIGKIIVDRLADEPLDVLSIRKVLQVHDQIHGLLPVEFLRPAHDEFLGVVIEV